MKFSCDRRLLTFVRRGRREQRSSSCNSNNNSDSTNRKVFRVYSQNILLVRHYCFCHVSNVVRVRGPILIWSFSLFSLAWRQTFSLCSPLMIRWTRNLAKETNRIRWGILRRCLHHVRRQLDSKLFQELHLAYSHRPSLPLCLVSSQCLILNKQKMEGV